MTLSRICRHRMLDKSCSSTSPLWKVSVSDLYIPGAWSLDRYLNLRPILIRAQFGATCGNFEIMWNMLFGTFIWYPQDQRCRKFTCFFGGDTREIPLFQPSFSTPGPHSEAHGLVHQISLDLTEPRPWWHREDDVPIGIPYWCFWKRNGNRKLFNWNWSRNW
jgi:hypothetical protein